MVLETACGGGYFILEIQRQKQQPDDYGDN